MFKIENQELNNLDKEIADFYKLNARYYFDLANLYGKKMYKSKLSELLNSIEKINAESEFDELLLKNMKSNLSLNDLVIDIFTEPNFSLPIEEFIDKIAGKGAWKYLEQEIKSPLWELDWKFEELTQERSFSAVSPSIEEAQKAAKELIPKIKEDTLTYAKLKNYLPNDFDITILLLPPMGNFSSWNPKNNVLSLNSKTFEFFHKKGSIIAVPTFAYQTVFHEVLGHASHQIYSDNMPLSLRFTDEIGSITPTKSVTEGVAINRELESYTFLRERMNDLGLTEEDVNLLEMGMKLKHNATYDLFFALIKEKEIEEKDFDGYEYLLSLTNNPVIARYFKQNFKADLVGVWKIFGHAFGELHYKKMEDLVKKRFGNEILETKKFNHAVVSGVWSREVYPEAVCYFLKNL